MNTSIQLQAQIANEQLRDRQRFAEKYRSAQLMKYGEDGKPQNDMPKQGWFFWLIGWLVS